MTPAGADVCLVLPPYAALERPSIALGLLKASLRGTGISCRIVHANFRLAEKIGVRDYSMIACQGGLVGDWTFARALFPSVEPSDDEFFAMMEEYGPELPASRGVQTLLCNVRNQTNDLIEQTAAEILALRPRIVGCSSVLMQHVASLALLQRIRQLAPDVVTMLGGGNCEGISGLATLRSFPFVDYVVSGEADLLFPELCRTALARGGSVPMGELPVGVLSQTSAGEIVESRVPCAVIDDLNLSPTPDYDDYFEELRLSPLAPAIIPTLAVETSRGCWWGEKHRCAFCGLMSGEGIVYRSKDVSRVLSEFATLSTHYGINRILCVDNMLDHRYLRTLMPALASDGPRYVIFYETKANLRLGDVQLLADAGVRCIQPGIESLHDEALRALGKGNSVAANLQLLKWALRFGIYVTWNLLVGIPGERDQWYADMAELVPLITHLQPPAGPPSPIQFVRHSRYVERAAEFGLDLVPPPRYAFVYPFPEEDRAHFANELEDRNDRFRYLRLRDPSEPGMSALRQAYNLWRHLWFNQFEVGGRMRPELRMSDHGGVVTIIDTRPAAVRVFWQLTSLESQIYRVCERAVTTDVLLQEVRSNLPAVGAEEVAYVTRRLQEAKLLACVGGRYLALAVGEPARPFVDILPYGKLDPSVSTRDLAAPPAAASSAHRNTFSAHPPA